MAEAVKTIRVFHPDEHFEGGHLVNESDVEEYKKRGYTTSKPSPKK